MNKMKFSWIFIFIILAGCSTTPRLYISDIRNLKASDKNSVIYSLPRTVLNIRVTLQQSTFIPGPYHEYAEKYLGLKDVSSYEEKTWNIKNISIDTYEEPDPDYFFSVRDENNSKILNDRLNSLSGEGLIMLPARFLKKGTVSTDFNVTGKDIYYKDLSVKRNLVVEKEITYKREFRDTAFVQIPVETESLKLKSLELKAEEAANFIIKLRKRKFRLLTGQNEGAVPDEGTHVTIEELNRIENEYLSLFTGKTYSETMVKVYEYLPLTNTKNDQQILFRLEENEGILDPLSAKGRPFSLEIKCLDITTVLDRIKVSAILSETENALVYRLPDLARVNLRFDGDMMAEGKFSIFQYGTLVTMNLGGY